MCLAQIYAHPLQCIMTVFHVSLECVSGLMQALEVTLTTSFMGLQFYSMGFSENGEPTALSLPEGSSDSHVIARFQEQGI